MALNDEVQYVIRELADSHLQRRHAERLRARLRDEGMTWDFLPTTDKFRAKLPDGTVLGIFSGDVVAIGVAVTRNMRAQMN